MVSCIAVFAASQTTLPLHALPANPSCLPELACSLQLRHCALNSLQPVQPATHAPLGTHLSCCKRLAWRSTCLCGFAFALYPKAHGPYSIHHHLQVPPLPEAFPDAASWCSALRPFVPEEVRAGLAQEVQRLASLTWLSLDGLPHLSRSDGRAGGGGGGSGVAAGRSSGGVGVEGSVSGKQQQQLLLHSSWCSLVFTLRGREGGWGNEGGGAGGGGEGERQPQEPPLKPTDVVLLTNSKVRS